MRQTDLGNQKKDTMKKGEIRTRLRESCPWFHGPIFIGRTSMIVGFVEEWLQHCRFFRCYNVLHQLATFCVMLLATLIAEGALYWGKNEECEGKIQWEEKFITMFLWEIPIIYWELQA